MVLKTLQSQDLRSGPAKIRCCGERESGPAELLHLGQLIAESTSSGTKDTSRMLSSSTNVAISTSGIVLQIF